MKDNQIPPFFAAEDELTESIRVDEAFPPGLASAMDFRSEQGRQTPFVQLLDALPIPALLVDHHCQVAFLNQACDKIGLDADALTGQPFSSVFDRDTDGNTAETLAKKVLRDRRPLHSEGLLEIGASRMWCRMHLRSLKTGLKRSVLVLLEDLTSERKQFLASRKRSKELRKAHDELEERVQERTIELAKAVESLRGEIEERRKAELRARTSEEKYRELAELLPQIVYEINPRGNFTFINRHGLNVLGYAPEDLERGISALQVFVPEERSRVAASLKGFMQGMKPTANEFTALRKDGTSFPVMAYASPIVRDNRVLGLRGVCVDITDRKLTEQALRESEQHYRLLTECSLAGICIVQDQVAVHVNDRFCEITGLTPEEIIGKDPWEPVHAEDRGKIGKGAAAGAGSIGPAAPYELRFLRKNGETKWLEALDVVIHRHGKDALLVNVADITERKLSEEMLLSTLAQLKTRDEATTEELLKTTGRLNDEILQRIRIEDALDESERRYRTLVETAKDIIWTVDLNLRFAYVSPAITRMLGYTPEKAMAMDPLDIVTHGSRERMRRAFSQELLVADEETGELFSSRSEEIEYQHKDGTVLWMEVTLTWLRGPDNSPLGLLGISRDITHRKEAEDNLQKALATAAQLRDEAEAANRAKGDFLASMSHELRTPLNAIIGFSEILQDETFGQLSKRQMRYVNHILNSGRHLLDVINDILDLAKIESGKMSLQVSRVNMRRLLEHSLVMIKEKAFRHRLRVSLHVDHDLTHGDILGDELKLKQIVFNLLSNAAKFTPDGGAITISATSEKGNVVVKVADTGIGVQPGDRERIFGAFEQVDSSYSRAQHGTGLGLALTRRMVALHEGKIWVESDGEGKGSTFVVQIPYIPPASGEQSLVPL
jgi:PAS domain S-box-containing protein